MFLVPESPTYLSEISSSADFCLAKNLLLREVRSRKKEPSPSCSVLCHHRVKILVFSGGVMANKKPALKQKMRIILACGIVLW